MKSYLLALSALLASLQASAFDLRPLPEGSLPAVHAARNGVYLVRWASWCQQVDQAVVKTIVNHFEAQTAATQETRKAVEAQLQRGRGRSNGWITAEEIKSLNVPLNRAQCNELAVALTRGKAFISGLRMMTAMRREGFAPMPVTETLQRYDDLILDIGRNIEARR